MSKVRFTENIEIQPELDPLLKFEYRIGKVRRSPAWEAEARTAESKQAGSVASTSVVDCYWWHRPVVQTHVVTEGKDPVLMPCIFQPACKKCLALSFTVLLICHYLLNNFVLRHQKIILIQFHEHSD